MAASQNAQALSRLAKDMKELMVMPVGRAAAGMCGYCLF
jgi:hypothetical protein